MQTPARITFHQMDHSLALETDVRDRIADLESHFGRIVSCRVSIEAPHRHHHQGRLFKVLVDIGVPGHRIVIGRSPDEHTAHADAYVAVRDAFRAARRQLEDYNRRRRGNVKVRIAPEHARVVHIEPDLEYGRLETTDGRGIYFHRNSVRGGIDRLSLGAEVRYHEEAGTNGPQASTVEAVGANGHHEPAY
jgi:ribosome-associated translation inhibitor RaiA/cold shock CspA family protein